MRLAVPALFGVFLCITAVNAQENTFNITEAEKTACAPDALRLCSSTYPDEGKLLTCMTANRQSLSATCAAVFKAGKRERGLR